jgi:hypothetical protein
MDFFMLMMLKQGSYQWAKDFLQSPAWTLLSQQCGGNTFSFSLPSTQPSVSITEFSCSESSVSLSPVSGTTTSGSSSSAPLVPTPVFEVPNVEDEQRTLKTPSPRLSKAKNAVGKKGGKAIHILDLDLRRSERIHNLHKVLDPQSAKIEIV